MAIAPPPRKFDRESAQRRVRHPLQSLRGYIRTFVTLEGAGIALIYLALWFWIGLALDYGIFQLFQFDWIQEMQTMTEEPSNTDLIIRLVLLVGLSVGLIALVGYKMVWRLLREFSDVTLALVLERRYPKQLGDRLITAVEMADPRMSEKYGYSQALVDKTVEQAAEEVEKLPVREVFAWNRLWMGGLLAAGLTLGLYLFVAVIYMGITAIGGTGSPTSFFGRFNGVAGIWFERNILLEDTYWPRRSYLEVVRFQDTDKHKGEMRLAMVGDGPRPDVSVRAFKWVVADHAVQGGWRPMRWQDLTSNGSLSDYVNSEVVGRAARVPTDWGEWTVDLDFLDVSVSNEIVPAKWQGKKIKDIRAERKDPSLVRLFTAAKVGKYVDELFDWRTWTMDQLQEQLSADKVNEVWIGNSPTGLLLKKQHPGAHQAFLDLFQELEELAESGGMDRTLRMLEIPETVQVYFRGQTKKKIFSVDKLKNHSKFAIPLSKIDESGRFTVRGEDYYTPYKKITWVPPPALNEITADIEAPAYQYYRLQTKKNQSLEEAQLPLRGLRQKFLAKASATGESNFTVPIGSSLTITARAEKSRSLKPGTLDIREPKGKLKGTLTPNVKIHYDAKDPNTFWIKLDNVTDNYDFNFVFEDEDNVAGKRRVKIDVALDAIPKEQEPIEAPSYLLKAKGRLPSIRDEKRNPPEDIFLITPIALINFEKGKFNDDKGLARVQWEFTYRQVDGIELVNLPDREKETPPPKDKDGDKEKGKDKDKKEITKEKEKAKEPPVKERPTLRGVVPMVAFEKQLESLSANENTLDLASIKKQLLISREVSKMVPGGAFPLTHQLREESGGFDVKTFIKDLRQDDALKLQLHYVVTVKVGAIDNNIETGPGVGDFPSSVKFLVISESELLLMVFKEETTLRAKLEKQIRRIKDGLAVIANQDKNLDKDDFDLNIAGISAGNVRNMLEDSKGVTRTEIFKEYQTILQNLLANRVQKEKKDQVQDKIIDPLELILNGAPALKIPLPGAFDDAEKAVADLKIMIEADDAAKRRGNKVTLKQANSAKVKLTNLVEDLEAVLNAMDSGLSYAEVRAKLEYISEVHKREIVERLVNWNERLLQEIFGSTPKEKSK